MRLAVSRSCADFAPFHSVRTDTLSLIILIDNTATSWYSVASFRIQVFRWGGAVTLDGIINLTPCIYPGFGSADLATSPSLLSTTYESILLFFPNHRFATSFVPAGYKSLVPQVLSFVIDTNPRGCPSLSQSKIANRRLLRSPRTRRTSRSQPQTARRIISPLYR